MREGWGNDGGSTMRKKRTGPARSESSIRCWSIREKGFRTASVCRSVSGVASKRSEEVTHLGLDVTEVDAQLF
jgi:hypothetical protein